MPVIYRMNQYIFELGKFFIGNRVTRTTDYSKKYYEDSLKNYDDENIILYPILIEHINFFKPETVLEIGCGNGRNLKCIENQYRCYGIEVTDYGYNKAKVNCNSSSIYHGSAERLPFDDDSIDLVFTVHALEQMPYILDSVIKEIYRVCKKGILLFEPVYERQGFWGKLHNFNSDYSRGIEQKLIDNNFNIVSVEDANYSTIRFNRTWAIKGVI